MNYTTSFLLLKFQILSAFRPMSQKEAPKMAKKYSFIGVVPKIFEVFSVDEYEQERLYRTPLIWHPWFLIRTAGTHLPPPPK